MSLVLALRDDRDDEEKNSLIACGLGISPSVRYFDPRTGIKLADYVINAETLNRGTIQRPDNIDKVVSIFLKLHNSGYRLNNDFNVFAEKYDQRFFCRNLQKI